MKNIDIVKENFIKKERNLSKYATLSCDAIRLKTIKDDIRPSFFHDIDKIIHSLSYTRYLSKTQVYTLSSNDHISKRITHVHYVSKIARTIGRGLNLNEDLIEAIALGHDIGHTPLGHTGEAILNEISLEYLGEFFAHNIQGVRYYMYVDHNGEGINLTVQTLDGIMTHNGEFLNNIYKPVKKDKEMFLEEYKNSYKNNFAAKKYRPMTLEACVVRISDIIGYIGRDIEDAIMLKKIKRSDIPKEIIEVLGDNNKDIINNIVLDIIDESVGKPYIKMSENIYNALLSLKKFNTNNIYAKSMTKEEFNYYKNSIKKLYAIYLDDLKNNNIESSIYQVFLNDQSKKYLNNTCIERQVLDFIAGMTDDFLVRELLKYGFSK